MKTRSAPGSVLERVLPEFLRPLTFTGPNPTESVPALLKQPISASLHSDITQCNYSRHNYCFLLLTVLLGTSLLLLLERKSINDFLLNTLALRLLMLRLLELLAALLACRRTTGSSGHLE